ncbi:hypothetical protein [Mucilaginibacter sp.]|uniref:hypothetical protein n=1 Tax=Mucilaginibacter sp. TaxID=1882438 RepID=UPI003265CE7F
MFKNFLKKLFTPEPRKENYIAAQLNDKIMPIDRGEVYEDPLDSFLKLKYYGEVTGGGTLLSETNEIEYCDVEIKVVDGNFNDQSIKDIIEKLEELGAPKGSKLIIEQTGEKIEFGKLEGLAIYLDGINLSPEVYENSDSEAIAEHIKNLVGIKSDVIRYHQGNTETALYFYGPSFMTMKNAITDLVNNHPECENARIVQIA